MTIYIANDHGGYHLKKAIMVHLQKKRIWVVNEGSDSLEIVRYPYYAAKVANAVSNNQADFGILICNTGIGMSIAANKFKNVRAALVVNEETARLTREHNNSNIICLGAKSVDEETAIKLVDIFIETKFIGDRHTISLDLIEKIESTNLTNNSWNIPDLEREQFTEPFYKNKKSNPNILLDTDMLTDCDDVAAIALLLNLEKMQKCKVLGVTVSSTYKHSASVVDVVNTYYNRADLPVGAPQNGHGYSRDDSCFLDILSQEFPHKIKSNEQAQNAASLMRELLSKSEDNSVTLVSIGYMTNISDLLDSSPDEYSPLNGVELAKQKICEWVCMGGNFPDDPAIDNVNFTRDPVPALNAIKLFPNKITFVGRDIGHNIYVGNDFHNLPDNSPLKRSYQLHRGRYGENWDHHTADPSTILYSVFGLSDFFDAQSGALLLNDDCSFKWDPTTPSNKSYLLQKADREELKKIMNDLIMSN